jgi:hypothetical protein
MGTETILEKLAAFPAEYSYNSMDGRMWSCTFCEPSSTNPTMYIHHQWELVHAPDCFWLAAKEQALQGGQ